MKMNMELEGRKLINTRIEEFKPGFIKSTNEYDDGTILYFTQTPEGVTVDSNKKLELQEDGFTVLIK